MSNMKRVAFNQQKKPIRTGVVPVYDLSNHKDKVKL